MFDYRVYEQVFAVKDGVADSSAQAANKQLALLSGITSE